MDKEIDILLIDEDPKDSIRYPRIMSEEGKIRVRAIPPPKHIEDLSLTPTPELVLIDYFLTKRQITGEFTSYRGGTLATYISEQLPETPLVLFSTKRILGENPNYEEEVQVVDWVLYKDNVIENPEYWKNFLQYFVIGFNQLRSIENKDRTWNTLRIFLNLNPYEEENLQRSSPPKGVLSGQWRIHGVAKWILQVLFKYPGIFYNSFFSASTLGMDLNSFYKEEVQEYFKEASYTGIFSEIKSLWWKDRLQEIGFRCIREEGLEPRLSENFITAFINKTGIKLEPSICASSGEEYANTICYVLKKPVKMKYTLGYLPDDRPESMEQARISYKALREADFKEELIPLADIERLELIKRG